MKILMVAPEPIFEPRGTPFSVVARLKAFSDMGHQVDLVTYFIGKDVVFPGVKIVRIPKIPGIKKVKIGPSMTKVPLDFFLFLKTIKMLLRERYDLLHTHEEAGFWGAPLSQIFRIPHVYDMHSSLPQQLKNFQFSNSQILLKIFEGFEKWVLKYSSAVITICPALRDYVKKLYPGIEPVLIENVVDYNMIFGDEDHSENIRRSLYLKDKKVLLYAGTFEPYQGLDLLIRGAAEVVSKIKQVTFLMVGGNPDQIAFYRGMVEKNGLGKYFIFTGQVLPSQVASYVRCADVLLSPRTAGTNTPLKIYSYLRSGLPIVATRLLTHTQVLNNEVAVLTEPTPEDFAQGILMVLNDKNMAGNIGKKAREMAAEKYSYSVYLDKLGKVIRQTVGREV